MNEKEGGGSDFVSRYLKSREKQDPDLIRRELDRILDEAHNQDLLNKDELPEETDRFTSLAESLRLDFPDDKIPRIFRSNKRREKNSRVKMRKRRQK